MELLRRDLVHAARSLARAPGFSLVSILILALGIGGTTAMFSILDRVLLQPLPYAESQNLVMLWEENRAKEIHDRRVAPARFRSWQGRALLFEDLQAYQALLDSDWITDGGSEKVRMLGVTPGFFELLGATPLLGRLFREGSEGSSGDLILSHAMWSGSFASDPGVIGRTIQLRDGPHRIIGVLPASFQVRGILPLGFEEGDDAFLFEPLSNIVWEARSYDALWVLGRLRERTSLEQAQAEMDSLSAALACSRTPTQAGACDSGTCLKRFVAATVGSSCCSWELFRWCC